MNNLKQDLQFLLEQLASGDQTALKKIFNLTYKEVYATVVTIVKNKHDAYEIVNEVYYHVWNSISKFDHNRPFKFWLNGIVIRQVNDYRRKIWKRFRLFEKYCSFQEEHYEESPEQSILKKEDSKELLKLINDLPLNQRIVLLYRYYHDYSNQEIAELLQVPIGTVESRIHNGLKRIQQRSQVNEESVPNAFIK